MDNNYVEDDLQSPTECFETEEEEVPSAYHETCENDEVEVTALGNTPEIETSNNNDITLSDDTSNSEIKRITISGGQDNSNLCLICDNKIYPMEKLNVDGKLYHKNCFRCFKCRTILSASNFTLNNNAIYCKTHYMELFKIRGKFDDDRGIQHEIITGNDSETIPIVDTKGLLAKFRELETGSGVPSQSRYSNRSNSNSAQRYVRPTDEIVRCDDVTPDELPPPETAKAMVAKFKAMETVENVPSPKSVEKMQLRARANCTPNANVRLQLSKGQISATEDPYDNTEQLPEEGATKNLMTKFQGAQE